MTERTNERTDERTPTSGVCANAPNSATRIASAPSNSATAPTVTT